MSVPTKAVLMTGSLLAVLYNLSSGMQGAARIRAFYYYQYTVNMNCMWLIATFP